MIEINYLSNGIGVILEPMNYLKSVSFGVWVKVGSADETAETNGISHVIEHMLFQGTVNRSAGKIAGEIAKLGGDFNAYTSKECTSFYVTTLGEKLSLAIELLGDMLQNGTFQTKDLEKEKNVILEEIDMYEDSPEDMAHEMLQKSVWKNHPLGFLISGERDVVRGFKREEVLGFKDKYYVAENIILSIAGFFDKKEVMEQLECSFHGISNGVVKRKQEKPVYIPCIYRKKQEMEQVHMNIAYPCIDYYQEERYALSIMNSIFGEEESSRLFQIIREKQGLTYSIYSYGSLFGKAGLFQIDAALNPSKQKAVFHSIQRVVEDFLKQGVTEEEVISAKDQIRTGLILGNENGKSRMNENGKNFIQYGRVIPIEETISKLMKVTKEEVENFAKRYLGTDCYSISYVGNITNMGDAGL